MLILSYNSDDVKCPPQGLMGPNHECRIVPKVSEELPESSNAKALRISSQVLLRLWNLSIHAVMCQDLLNIFWHNSNGKFLNNLP